MFRFLILFLSVIPALGPLLAQSAPGSQPTDHLPAHMRQLTSFGERADWSHDGTKLVFLSKTFGDAMELDLDSGAIRNLTAHYPHFGYTRALYLVNGNILLAGPREFDLNNTRHARRNCWLFVLTPGSVQPAAPLGIKANEGPAVSRTRLHIAWTDWHDPAPDSDDRFYSRMYRGDIAYNAEGVPGVTRRELIADSRETGLAGAMETQNFRPPHENELIFSLYTGGGRHCDVMGIDLTTRAITAYTNSPDGYEEPEGIYPDGTATLVEADMHNQDGPRRVDWWRLPLDGSGPATRLTFFSDFQNYKCSNPVVSDDGRYIAGQIAKSTDDFGVGHGLILYDTVAAEKSAALD